MKMRLNVSCAKWRLLCLGLNVLSHAKEKDLNSIWIKVIKTQGLSHLLKERNIEQMLLIKHL